MKKICYRIGTGPCQTGWVDTANCTDPNIYSLAIGGVVVAGAVETPCGDCPATSTDGEFVIREYAAKADGPGYVTGNTLEMRQAYNMAAVPPAPVGAPVWTNLTTGTAVTPDPVMSTLTAGPAASSSGSTATTLETTQVFVRTAVEAVALGVGAPADAVASSDTGTFSLVALTKRVLQSLTTLLARTPAPVVRTPLLQSGVITAGTVAAGAYEVGFSNDGTTNATVAGGALAPGRSVSFVTHGNDTLAAIAYTASATSALTIVSVR